MTERFLLKAGPQMLKATRAQSHFSAPVLTKDCFKRVRIVRQDFRRDLLRVSICRSYPSQSDYETGHSRFPISPQARRGLARRSGLLRSIEALDAGFRRLILPIRTHSDR